MENKAPFIDFHTHTFPDKLQAAITGWFQANTEWRWHFEGSWREITAHLEAMKGLIRYVTFGYAHKPGIARELNQFYAELMKASPKAVALMCAHQDDEDLKGIAKEAFGLGLKGVKIHCQVQKVSPSDERFFPLYEEVIDNGGIVMLHAGNGPFTGPFVGFEHFAPLMKRYPELNCVVAHLGCFEPEEFLREALKRENLYLDTSYTFIKNPSNLMDAPVGLVKEACGKILYASDFPGICHPYGEGLEALLKALALSPEEERAILYENGRRLLLKAGVTL